MKHVWILMLVALCTGCSTVSRDRDTIYQVSTLQALMAGAYDGNASLKELRRHGDFGIGTFHALNGEMVVSDGEFFQVRSDGKVYRPKSTDLSPYANLTYFEKDLSYILPRGTTFDQLKVLVDAGLPTTNLPYAIRLAGKFSYVKTRSVPAQSKPYPPLAEVAKTQPVFEFTNRTGVLIGYRLPEYLAGVNMPGYHLHFLSAEKDAGGHLLDFVLGEGTVEVDVSPVLHIVLPETEEFSRAATTGASKEDLHAAER